MIGDTLHLENNFLDMRRYLLIIILAFSSCKNSERESFYVKANHTADVERIILKCANDTINKWIKLRIKGFAFDSLREDWKIEKYVFLNSKKDKCILNMPHRILSGQYNTGIDRIEMLLAEKYENEWWFYPGPDYVILRETYTKDTDSPLPFDKLSEIARRNALSWYYIEKPPGTCLKKLFSEGYESYKKCGEEKYVINDQYFESGFNWEADRKNHSKFLNERFKPDSVTLNQ